MRLTYLRLHVADYAGCLGFWRDTVGLALRFGDDAGGYAEFETGDATLAIFDARLMAAAVPGVATPQAGAGGDRVLGSFELEDVDAAYERLMAAGVRFVAPPVDQVPWGIRAAHFRDPEDNLFEIYRVLETGGSEPATGAAS